MKLCPLSSVLRLAVLCLLATGLRLPAQILPTPSYVPVTAASDGTLRAPLTLWTANAASITTALGFSASYQPLSTNLTSWSAIAPSVKLNVADAFTQAAADARYDAIGAAAAVTLSGLGGVPTSLTVNGHALSANVTVTPSDLSLVIGTNTQAHSANLDTFATYTPTTLPISTATTTALGAKLTAASNLSDVASFSAVRANTKIASIYPRPYAISDTIFPNGVWAQVGSETKATYRLQYPLRFDGTNVRLTYCNSYSNPDEILGAGSITVKARLVYNGVNWPVYFGGQRSVVIAPGALVTSDPIPVELAVATAAAAYVDTCVDAGSSPASTAALWPTNQYGYTGHGEYLSLGNDLTGQADAAPASTSSSSYYYAPVAVTAESATEHVVVGVIGDSIAAGMNENTAYSRYSDGGFIRRALAGANLPMVRVARGGEYGSNFNGIGGRVRRQIFQVAGVNNVIDEFSSNDIAYGQTFTQIQASALVRWRNLSNLGYRIFACTLLPRTTSTDAWRTAANQTPASGFASGGYRDQYNTWVKTTPAPLTGFFDTATAVQDVTSVNVWKASPAVWSGNVATNPNSSTLTVSGTPWTPNQFVDAVVHITGGTGYPNGYWASIASNTNNTLTPVPGDGWNGLDATTTFEIFFYSTKDGTHPINYSTTLLTTVVDTSKLVLP